ncbi:MAG TPA: VWA domain-containing protein [Vicinamibacteria bacterium]|nr:VWA domain-containing protein [Vicinamibacteria bacterium]
MSRVLLWAPELKMLAAVWLVVASGSAVSGAPSGAEQCPTDRIQFAVSVETVTLDVVVVDARGRFVPNLKAESFEVFEDGEPQELSFFTSQFTPVKTMLLLDSSSSIRSNLSAIQTAGYLFVRNLSEGDTARIGLFNSEVRFGAGFTDDVNEHFQILRSMKPAGKTALYDALLAALAELDRLDGRRSLLLFTDGDDAGPAEQGSTATMEQALESAKLSEVTIYTVGFTGWGPEGSDSVNRPFLTSLAESTGGRAFFPEDVEQVKDAFAEVQEDLHRHYRLAYMPSRGLANEDAAWRQLRVNVKDRLDLRVRTRQGYYPRKGSAK